MVIGVSSCLPSSYTPIAPPVDEPITETKPPTSPSMIEVPGVEARMFDSSWISPAEVEVGNYYPGARAEWVIRIHNGGNSMSKYNVTYRTPNYPRDGYDMPPDQAKDWVTIEETMPLLGAKETKEILVSLAVPKNVQLDSKQWEFWISVVEGGQGLVQTELCQRWLISCRSER